MSVIYLIALVGVGLALAAVTLESVLSVARKPHWAEPVARPSLHVVATIERRENELPFVGAERRQPAAEPVQEVKASRVA